MNDPLGQGMYLWLTIRNDDSTQVKSLYNLILYRYLGRVNKERSNTIIVSEPGAGLFVGGTIIIETSKRYENTLDALMLTGFLKQPMYLYDLFSNGLVKNGGPLDGRSVYETLAFLATG